MLSQVLGQPVQRHADRLFAALANDAPVGLFDLGGIGRQNDRAAHVQPRPGQGRLAALAKLHEVSAAQARLLVGDHQVHQRIARLLGLLRRQPPGLLGRPLGLGTALQVQQPRQPLKMVLFAPDDARLAAGPGPHPAVAQCLAVQEPDQPRLPAIGDLDHRLRAPQLDSPHAATVQAAGVVEQGEDVGLGGPARQGFEVDQCHASDYTGSLGYASA